MATPRPNSHILRLIAIFKLCKAALLIGVGISVLKLAHGGTDPLEEWVGRLALKPGAHYLDEAVAKLAHVSPKQLKEAGFGSFVYAALFLTEGIGLWLNKPWAEWFTTIITGSLIPFEIYEIFHHFTILKLVAFAINLAIVIYLILHIRKERAQTN